MTDLENAAKARRATHAAVREAEARLRAAKEEMRSAERALETAQSTDREARDKLDEIVTGEVWSR